MTVARRRRSRAQSSHRGTLIHVKPLDPHPGEPQLTHLTRVIREFSVERDWVQFQDPKSLVLAMTGEVGEVAELLQWLPAGDAVAMLESPDRHARIGEEIADVMTYLLRLADVLGVDVYEAVLAKQAVARERFPVDRVRGRAQLKE